MREDNVDTPEITVNVVGNIPTNTPEPSAIMNTNTPESVFTSTSTRTRTPRPTITPIPTETITYTPVPTSTPLPTNTPVPVNTSSPSCAFVAGSADTRIGETQITIPAEHVGMFRGELSSINGISLNQTVEIRSRNLILVEGGTTNVTVTLQGQMYYGFVTCPLSQPELQHQIDVELSHSSSPVDTVYVYTFANGRLSEPVLYYR